MANLLHKDDDKLEEKLNGNAKGMLSGEAEAPKSFLAAEDVAKCYPSETTINCSHTAKHNKDL